jgi:formylglycine-generating enzyme required for sulfatase activity
MEQNIMIHHYKTVPGGFPYPWVSSYGEDLYGIWCAFTVHDVMYRLRWIDPGEFLMGSPEDEVERRKSEKQHRVILTSGYWLGETACTQGLWQAVMGDNPSDFKGSDMLPVDSVSWDDCVGFIKEVNMMVPGIELRLPWEAEWEYACRAGTTTPFHFGENITTDQVNYDGNFPYAGGRKGNTGGKRWR